MCLSAANVHYTLNLQTISRVGWQFRWQSIGCLGESAAAGNSLAESLAGVGVDVAGLAPAAAR